VLTDRALVGLQEATHKGRVLTAREDLLTYASDATPLLRQTPGAIVIPKDAEEVAAILALANEEGFAVVPRGAA